MHRVTDAFIYIDAIYFADQGDMISSAKESWDAGTMYANDRQP